MYDPKGFSASHLAQSDNHPKDPHPCPALFFCPESRSLARLQQSVVCC